MNNTPETFYALGQAFITIPILYHFEHLVIIQMEPDASGLIFLAILSQSSLEIYH